MADDIRNTNELDWDSGLPAVVSESMPENYIPEEGEYGFTVRDMEKTFSKAGNKMAKLSIVLDDQYHYKVTDYIVLTQAWKCAQFFEALGFKKRVWRFRVCRGIRCRERTDDSPSSTKSTATRSIAKCPSMCAARKNRAQTRTTSLPLTSEVVYARW